MQPTQFAEDEPGPDHETQNGHSPAQNGAIDGMRQAHSHHDAGKLDERHDRRDPETEEEPTMKRAHLVSTVIALFAASLLVPFAGSAAGPRDVTCSQVTFLFTGTARDLIVPEGGGCEVRGATITRDLIVQFYVTLQRMIVNRSVSYKQAMGPVGIFRAGTTFADRGADWLIWFLCMISANLAVVNFLPIPIVDGGLFTFLIIEKIQGKPISPRVQSIAQLRRAALCGGRLARLL